MKIVEAQLPGIVEINDNYQPYAERETKQVNQGSSSLLQKVTEGVFKIAENHILSFKGFPFECQIDARIFRSPLLA
jgi:hypothetical protein